MDPLRSAVYNKLVQRTDVNFKPRLPMMHDEAELYYYEG